MCKILTQLKTLAVNEGITIGALERQIGASKGVLSRAINNGTDIQTKWISAIVENYPQYSTRWLLSGTGNMLKSDGKTDIVPSTNTRSMTKPRIPIEAAAGSLSITTDSVTESQCERFPIIPRFPTYDFTIIVKGNSMEPEFCSGDEIACRLIDNPTFIQWGRPHVLDTQQGIVLKSIYNRSNSILCKSYNKDYEDFEIPKDDILHIALVVGSVRLY